MSDSRNDLYVTWSEYYSLIERLADSVRKSGWQFDAIVCLARGGLRVGDVFSRVFDKPLGVLFTSSYREAGGTQQGRLILGEHLASAEPLPQGRWLVLDDLADSGATLEAVMPALRQRYPQVREMRSAVLWVKAVSSFRPDYFVEYLPENPWIHQPFEHYEQQQADQR
jgi:hypoxanthine phosphoribosyltransferase